MDTPQPASPQLGGTAHPDQQLCKRVILPVLLRALLYRCGTAGHSAEVTSRSASYSVLLSREICKLPIFQTAVVRGAVPCSLLPTTPSSCVRTALSTRHRIAREHRNTPPHLTLLNFVENEQQEHEENTKYDRLKKQQDPRTTTKSEARIRLSSLLQSNLVHFGSARNTSAVVRK